MINKNKMAKLKIFSIEIAQNPDKKFTGKELSEMVGWIDYDQDKDVWDVTMADGCGFECPSQEIAQIIASSEGIKAMMIGMMTEHHTSPSSREAIQGGLKNE